MRCIQTCRRLTRARLGEARDLSNELRRFLVTCANVPKKESGYPQQGSTSTLSHSLRGSAG